MRMIAILDYHSHHDSYLAFGFEKFVEDGAVHFINETNRCRQIVYVESTNDLLLFDAQESVKRVTSNLQVGSKDSLGHEYSSPFLRLERSFYISFSLYLIGMISS